MTLSIMLVDDSSICNLIMRKQLARLSMPVTIHDFTDPCLALTQLSQLKPTVVFLDLNMPQLDGWGFLGRMKETGQTHQVIILTSSTSMLDRSRCAEFPNVIAYHTKPLNFEMIHKLLSNL
jgi:two-component system nitrate/nitrite response regulator NarL